MTRTHQLWLRIREPRVLKVAAMVLHLVILLTGVVTLISPPNSIAGPIGPFLATVWACFFIFGGVLGLVTVLPGFWATERLAILSSGVALSIYLSVILTLHFTEPGSRATQLGVIAIAGFALIFRHLTIRRFDYEPRPSTGPIQQTGA